MLPLYLLTNAKGQQMFIELKNGETIQGDLNNVDNWMNVTLVNVTHTASNEILKLPEIYVRGNFIKYIKLQDDVIEKVKQSARDNQSNNNRDNRRRNNQGGRRGDDNRRFRDGGRRDNINNRDPRYGNRRFYNRQPPQQQSQQSQQQQNNGMGGFVQHHQNTQQPPLGHVQF